MESGDYIMAPKPPTEENGEVGVAIGIGDSQRGVAHKLIQELVKKEADEQGVEKKGREKAKKRERRREASGWRAQLINCFVCGAANQDQDQQQERDHVKTRQKAEEAGSYAPKEDKRRNKKEKKQRWEERGQRDSITSVAAVMTEKERMRGRRESSKAVMACLQRYHQRVRDDSMRKMAYRSIQRSRKVVEANTEWGTLPLETEDAGKKVSFCEQHLCDVWLFEEEPKPSQRCLAWKRALERIRRIEMGGATQEKRVEKAEQLRGREEGQCAVMSAPKGLLLVMGMALCVFLWISAA
ncbi:MAP7 domain-containing protein 2-like [Alosa sapidissima]|uniref:MAP7 domain-containing protein 2-like n=1 Tax=Alosa sapidissima TaxID=34773 RepID=UPI001C086D6F|nr:MAP7 domain-containing protein 2-like [Alosa sapidissima]